MRIFFLFTFWISFFSIPSLSAPLQLPAPQVETLENGLRIAWFTQDRLPVVDFAVLTETGYRDDPKGKSGTAQLLSSVLDRGVDGKSAAALSQELDEMGATNWVSADDDTFTIGVHGLSLDANTLLNRLADIVLRPNLSSQEILSEREKLEDRWRHVGDQAAPLASVVFSRAMLSGTVYARGGMISLKELRSVTPSDVRNFYGKHFVPENSILMIVGQVDRIKFGPEIKKLFSGWKGKKTTASLTSVQLPRFESGKMNGIFVEKPGTNQAHVHMGIPMPGFNHPDHYALIVANALIGEYYNSRLNLVIRDKLAVTYSIGSAISHSRDFSYFTVSSATRSSGAGQLISEVKKILKRLQTDELKAEEVEMAKSYLVGGFPLRMATLGSIASRWLSGSIFHRGNDFLNEFIPKVQAVTAQQVQQAIRRHFDLSKMVVVVSGDPKMVSKSLKVYGLSPFKHLKPQDLL